MEKKRILVVEDEVDMRRLLVLELDAAGYEVFQAEDGLAGLELCKEIVPDLIISDVLMPRMDGFTFYKELKQNQITSEIPVFILTARGKMEDTFKVFGVDEFVSKPFIAEDLLARIENIFSHKSDEKEEVAPEISVQERDTKKDSSSEEKSGSKEVKNNKTASFATPEGHLEELLAVKTEVIIFGTNNEVLTKMTKQLKDENCNVTVLKKEDMIYNQVSEIMPKILLLQLKVDLIMPLDEIVYTLSELLNERIREFGRDSGSTNLLIYKVDEEKVGVDSVGEDIANMDSLMDRCTEYWPINYIGAYTELTFPSKIRKFL